MSLRSSVLLAASMACYGQTAISELTSYWEMDITTADRVLWDSKGSAHGLYIGIGLTPQTSIFGGGTKVVGIAPTNDGTRGGLLIPPALVNSFGSFAYAFWCRPDGTNYIAARRRSGTDGIDWSVALNTGSSGRATLTLGNTSGSTSTHQYTTQTVNTGDLMLIWIAYDSVANLAKITINGGNWASGTPVASWQANASGIPLYFGQAARSFGPGTTVGRSMYWNGYIPTDAERTAIYNSGAGRDYSYFSATPFTPPTRPLTVTYQGVLADDANLTGQQGLYFMRPYPLKTWSPALAAIHGDYMWGRSTDHTTGGIWIGFSSSPEVLPASWTKIKNASAPTGETTGTWTQAETPFFEWDPDTSKVLMYAHSIDSLQCGSPCVQLSHWWESSDLTTWTYGGIPFPQASGRTHTGYAQVKRRGAGDWVARSNLTDQSNATGYWTSIDGRSWTLAETRATSLDVVDGGYLTPTQLWGESIKIGQLNQHAYVTTVVDANPSKGTYPPYLLFFHDGSRTGGNWLQDVQSYVEGNTVWVYAKWSFNEPSTTRLFKGTLPSAPQSSSLHFGGVFRIGGSASAK